MPDLLRSALWYAARGWAVFPCAAGDKLPLTKHGLNDASIEAAKIHAWWKQWPTANVAIATGQSGLVVVDVDVKNGAQGVESWRDLVATHGQELESTVCAETPSGGLHYYFKANGRQVRNSASKLGPGLDVRAQGGYVVAPPSKTPEGEYAWAMLCNPVERQLAELPVTLANVLQTEIPTTTVEGDDAIPAGQRNDTLASIAGLLRAKGMGAEAILAVLKIENQRCKPPLDEDELAKIAGSIARYTPAPATHNLTDLGNALRFVEIEGENVRYCHKWGKWLVWDEQRWQIDESGLVEIKAQAVVRDMLAEAAKPETSKERRESLARYALSCESLAKRRAWITSAQPYVAITPDELDQDPWLMNCLNGTLDLRTGELGPPRREDLLTKLTPVRYDPEATCPTWLAFQAAICDGHDDLVAFKQKAFGYGLTGDVSEQVFFLHYGTGSNGKTTELTTLREVLGPDYALHTPTETLMVQRSQGVPNDVARLRAMRFVTAIESEAGRRLAESLVKQLTGGDTLTARFLYGEFFEFKPTHKLYLAANHKPEIRGTDHAMWRRIRLIPYEVTIPDAEQDRQLPEKLMDEAEGILAWLVEGCLRWQAEGLKPPRSVVEATESYRNEMDALGEFITDCCVMFPGAEVKTADLYEAYEQWCQANGEKDLLSKRGFTMRLIERGGILREHTRNHRSYRGIGLKVTPVQAEVFEPAPEDDSPDTDSIPF